MFADEGVPVFDADAAVHRLQGPAGAIVAKIEEAFGGTTGPQGVNRSTLADLVLADPEKLAQLESIVHPAVAAERAAFFDEHVDAPMVLLDIPLLFETGGESQVDKVAVVSASADTQRARVLARAGMTPARFESILARQMPDAEKRARADFVIDTSLSLDRTRDEVRRIVACLTAGSGR
jgi:dephospho-CoA kinase